MLRLLAGTLVFAVACGAPPGPAPEGDEKADELSGTRTGSRLPDMNAAEPPPADWRPPSLSRWPDAYVIFNATGCGHDCTRADQDALTPRSVMLKMLNAAIRGVQRGGTVRIANFNISSSPALEVLHEALRYAMKERGATVKIVMDSAQDSAQSRTNALAADGAEVRFLVGLRYPGSAGIMHSKMVIVDDRVVFAGSNNFSSSGLITNEENSVVLRAPRHLARVQGFTCQFERMFEAGVAPGQTQPADDEPRRRAAIVALDACETDEQLFPPAGALTENRSHGFDALGRAIREAQRTIDVAPDLLAHPGIVSALARRARQAKQDGASFRVRLVLDGSKDALELPAFGECLDQIAARDGLAIEVRYWPGTEEIFQLLHHKFMLVDAGEPEATLWNGSANYSAKALKWSFENLNRYRAAEFRNLVAAFETRFEKVFEAARTRDALAAEEGLAVPACPLDLDTL